jgi:hypothetical protein
MPINISLIYNIYNTYIYIYTYILPYIYNTYLHGHESIDTPHGSFAPLPQESKQRRAVVACGKDWRAALALLQGRAVCPENEHSYGMVVKS